MWSRTASPRWILSTDIGQRYGQCGGLFLTKCSTGGVRLCKRKPKSFYLWFSSGCQSMLFSWRSQVFHNLGTSNIANADTFVWLALEFVWRLTAETVNKYGPKMHYFLHPTRKKGIFRSNVVSSVHVLSDGSTCFDWIVGISGIACVILSAALLH